MRFVLIRDYSKRIEFFLSLGRERKEDILFFI